MLISPLLDHHVNWDRTSVEAKGGFFKNTCYGVQLAGAVMERGIEGDSVLAAAVCRGLQANQPAPWSKID